MAQETCKIGRVATKPTQAQEDTVNAGIMRWLLQGTKFQLKRKYTVDAYAEEKANVDAIAALLPKDFKAGMENWGGEIYEHISDTNFGLLLHDMMQQRKVIVYATDLDGDRLTDLMADAPDALRAWGQLVLDHVKAGTDMPGLMSPRRGEPIYEQTLGSADAMLLRLLAGDETVGGEKQPYDPRIHFVLINEAYKAANPGNKELADWLDAQLAIFDKVYGGKRPRYLDAYNKLKEAIKPWGSK